MYVTLKELSKTPPASGTSAPRRRTIVVLSDGHDTTSPLGFEELLEFATRSDAAIYTIQLNGRNLLLRRSDTAEFALRRLAEQTGGRAFVPLHRYELPRVYAEIMRELSSQYALAYQSDGVVKDTGFRSLSVQVQRPDAVARTKRGYFARDK